MKGLNIDPEQFNLAYMGYGSSASALQNGTIEGMNTPAGVPVGAVTQAFAALGEDIKLLSFTDEQIKQANGNYEALLESPDVEAVYVPPERERRVIVVDAGHGGFALGCDKRFATCRDRFANTLNFRGFPYMVGNDALQASPASETVRDGGSRGLGG